MFASRFIPHALPAVLLGAGLLFTGCGESPTAPLVERAPALAPSEGTPLTRPDRSAEVQEAVDILEVDPQPRVRV